MTTPTLGLKSNLAVATEVTLPRKYNNIDNTEDELLARSTACSVCNAPPHVACHSLRWTGAHPVAAPRKHHARRVKDAVYTQGRMERMNRNNGVQQ